MAKKPRLGSGARFEACKERVAGHADDPAAVCAAIGRKKYGAEKMAKLSASAHKKGFEHFGAEAVVMRAKAAQLEAMAVDVRTAADIFDEAEAMAAEVEDGETQDEQAAEDKKMADLQAQITALQAEIAASKKSATA